MLTTTTTVVTNNNHHGRLEVNEPTTQAANPRVIRMLSTVLERLVARNEELLNELIMVSGSSGRVGKKLSGFDGIRAPNISIPKYLERIYKYTECSPSCFVVGFVYIDRLVHKNPDSFVISLNVHRLIVTSVMVASKVLDDVHYNNAFYAKVGGVSNVELNRLELEMLFLLDFEVMVKSSVFESYCMHLEKEMMIINGGIDGKIERGLSLNSNDNTSIIVDDDYLDGTEISQGCSPPQETTG